MSCNFRFTMKQFVFNTTKLLEVWLCVCMYVSVCACTKRCERRLDQARCISANFILLVCNVKSWQMIRHPVLIIPSLLPVRFLVNVWSIKRSFTNPSINIQVSYGKLFLKEINWKLRKVRIAYKYILDKNCLGTIVYHYCWKIDSFFLFW